MAKIKVTLVGLGAIGCSIGLGLQQGGAEVELMGHDKEPLASREAAKMGAVHKTHWNLIAACDDADLVILALPLRAIQETLEVLGPELKADSVVMDTATVKTPVLEWAKTALPERVHFVGTNPIVASAGKGSEAAKGDLFQEATWAICSAPSTVAAAMELVTSVVSTLGAEPYYMDPQEHDGLLAATDHAPLVLGAALLRAVAESGTQEQMGKIGGPTLARVTRPVMTDVAIARDVCLLNGKNIGRWLRNLQQALDEAKKVVESGDEEQITALFQQAQNDWIRWLKGEEGQSLLDQEDMMPSWRTTLFGRIRRPDSSRKK